MARTMRVLLACALFAACSDGGGGSAPASTTGGATSAPPTSAAVATTEAAATTEAPATTEGATVTTFSTFGPDGPYDPARDARADIANAQAVAAASGKLVLLDFGANWCPDCLVLDELYRDPAVAELLRDHFVLVTVDIGEWDHNMDISDDYNHVADVGIPALVVLTADGEILGDTHDGQFASASGFVPQDVLDYLEPFVG